MKIRKVVLGIADQLSECASRLRAAVNNGDPDDEVWLALEAATELRGLLSNIRFDLLIRYSHKDSDK